MAEEFFTDLENTRPFLKMAAQGFAGTGKTFTLARVAVGLHRRIGSDKPIAIIDTESAAQWLKPYFRAQGIPAVKRLTRSLTDVSEAIHACEMGAADILMIDSITHIWDNWIESFKKEKNITELRFQHWGQIKPRWKERFADPFVRSRIHILMTGRAAFTYGQEKNEDTGKKEMVVTGSKMRVEGETAYEPDILIEMARYEERTSEGLQVWREATVLKDRADMIDGKSFKNPDYSDFAPVVEYLLASASDSVEPVPGDDSKLVRKGDDADRARRQRQVVLEEIEAEMVAAAPGQTAVEKAWKVTVLQEAFGTGSWKKLEGYETKVLAAGLDVVRAAAKIFKDKRTEVKT